MEKFIVLESHLKLLRSSYVSWLGAEAGSACINPKRPYGNSNVAKDVAEIIGLPVMEEMPDAVEDMLHRLHKETKIVLQIVLCTGKFEAGAYILKDRYSSRSWERVS